MKWTLSILGTLLVLAALAAAGAWFCFPWYAQRLIDQAVEGKGIKLQLHDPGRPGPGGIAFGRIDAIVTAPRDTCTGIAPVYAVAIHHGRLAWRTSPSSQGATVRLILTADTVTANMKPANILFRDREPLATAKLDIIRKGGLAFGVSPDSLAYAVRDGVAETGKLRLDGVSYGVLLTRTADWVQQPSKFRAVKLVSGEVETPLTGFEATFGMKRDPEKPCTLTFRDCSVVLYGIRASTPEIDYSLRNRQTAFTLHLENLPMERLAEIGGIRNTNPAVTGNLSGAIPVQFLDRTLRIRNALVDASEGTVVTWKGAGGKPLFSFDAGRRRGGPPTISGLEATVTLNAKDDRLTGIRIEGLSSRIFGGAATATSAIYEPATGTASCTVSLRNVPLLERLRLHGEFKGSMSGSVSGTIPLSLSRNGIAVRHAKLSSPGKGTITQRAAARAGGALFGGTGRETVWNFSEPSITLDRDQGASTRIGFTLKQLERRSNGGELVLAGARGNLALPGERQRGSIATLTNFTAGLFDGSVSIDRVDYDVAKRHASTVVELNGIPLQKLLDLQGTKKIFATGTVRGRIPVVLDGESFSIPDGGVDAERSGKIIYTTTPEERAAANAGMRITYEALGNFLYSELVSSITMSPDGQSRISLQLKGYNPEFQNGRPVNLNLNIEQNLLDLFRSLSISSGIEQEISEKALRKGR